MNIQDLIQDVEEVSSHSLAPATIEAYQNAYDQYQAILPLIHGAPPPFPITAEKIVIFLAYKRKMDVSYNTIVTLYRCLSAYCRDKNYGDFSDDDRITKYIQGLNRDMLGSKCPHQVDGINSEILRLIESKMDPTRFYDLRDLAAFTLNYEGFFRASEMLNLDLSDINIAEDKMIINISKSKTDQTGVGRTIYIHKSSSQVSAFTWVQRYLKYRSEHEIESNKLFVSRLGRPLIDRNYRQRLKNWIAKIGYDAEAYSTHSFRVGAVQSATKFYCSPAAIKTQGGWKSNCFLRYARISEEEAGEILRIAFA